MKYLTNLYCDMVESNPDEEKNGVIAQCFCGAHICGVWTCGMN